MMTGSICVSKIDKNRLKKGTDGLLYLEVVVLESSGGAKKFSDWMVIESLPKAERDAGKRGTLIGNLKNASSQSGGQRADAPPPPSTDDLPF